jgi:hypothetical protein
MPLHVGIVGLPNVGKSTLFSAITKSAADCANYPFCTIDPNVGVVEVPDSRLTKLAEISTSQKVIPTTVEFVDIAGLVKGASEGQGLGNKFLSHIRECDAIAQVVRTFPDPDVIHVDGSVDPVRDAETIDIELALADLETVTKRQGTVASQMKSGRTKELETFASLLERVRATLEAGTAARSLDLKDEEKDLLADLHLLTMKPMIYVVNVSETELQDGSWASKTAALKQEGIEVVPVSVRLEAELAGMSDAEKKEYLASLGQTESGLDRLIRAAYKSLGLITFLTSGEKESRAWTVPAGATAPEAAGVIHSDFEKHFIRVEVCDAADFIAFGGEQGCKEHGKLRIEGKDYVMRDGDVCYFRVDA